MHPLQERLRRACCSDAIVVGKLYKVQLTLPEGGFRMFANEETTNAWHLLMRASRLAEKMGAPNAPQLMILWNTSHVTSKEMARKLIEDSLPAEWPSRNEFLDLLFDS